MGTSSPKKSIAEVQVGLLYYLAGAEYAAALVCDSAGRQTLSPIPDWQGVLSSVDTFRHTLHGPDSHMRKAAAVDEFAFGWGQLLLPASDCLERFDVLVVIPHYVLYGLPFHAVWLRDRESFLGAMLGVTYCTSGTAFRQCLARNPVRWSRMAPWTYSLNPSAVDTAEHRPTSCFAFATDVLHDKSATYRELADLFVSYFRKPVVNEYCLQERANLKRRQEDAVCVVCHGYYDQAQPENSGLLLENGLGWGGGRSREFTFADGSRRISRDLPFRHLPLAVDVRPDCYGEFLAIDELKVDLAIETQLVALLGCSTAVGHASTLFSPGTLAEQWMRGEAASVVGTLWECSVQTLRTWIRHFTPNWVQRRQPKAVAWQASVKNSTCAAAGMRPYDWAPFVLLGDWL